MTERGVGKSDARGCSSKKHRDRNDGRRLHSTPVVTTGV